MAKYEAISGPWRFTVDDDPLGYINLNEYVISGPEREWRKCTPSEFRDKKFTTCTGAIRFIKKYHGENLVFSEVSK